MVSEKRVLYVNLRSMETTEWGNLCLMSIKSALNLCPLRALSSRRDKDACMSTGGCRCSCSRWLVKFRVV